MNDDDAARGGERNKDLAATWSTLTAKASTGATYGLSVTLNLDNHTYTFGLDDDDAQWKMPGWSNKGFWNAIGHEFTVLVQSCECVLKSSGVSARLLGDEQHAHDYGFIFRLSSERHIPSNTSEHRTTCSLSERPAPRR